jgi:hypothetical protein
MEACLDQAFDAESKLSRWVTQVSGDARHSGGDEDFCGDDGFYTVKGKTGRLKLRVEVERAGRYALRFRYRAGTSGENDEAVRVVVATQRFDFPDSVLADTRKWEKSDWVEVVLEKGANTIELRSNGKDGVDLEQVELECREAP